MIEIEIDGKPFQAEPGAMIIEVADKAGIPIPRFCYHKKLSIAANCRMCLVDVEKAPKPLPACATPVAAGMKVSTVSNRAKEAQRAVMEFLLINHPLDCPICDQGGECELQDVSLMYGSDVSRFNEGKRSVKDDNLGPLIATEMTRCIQCTRCVRFCTEIAGIRELGATGRGENLEITTYVQHSMTSELSGNIIDLCPVGALTSKPFRFRARAWELTQNPAVAPHDCVGSNIYTHTLRQAVMRVVPRENEKINEMWLSDRDRFSYLGINHENRLLRPLVKTNGEWQEVDWPAALLAASEGLQKVKQQYGAEQIAALVSPSSTLEEQYLLQKLMRGFGSNNIDHRLQQTDCSDQDFAPLTPRFDLKISDIESQDFIILVGSNIQREQPIIGHRVRKASLKGAKILSVNLSDYAVNFNQQQKIITAPNDFIAVLAKIIKALGDKNNLCRDFVPSEQEQNFVKNLNTDKKGVILLGALAQNHPQAAIIRSLCELIAELTNFKIGVLTTGANGTGAWLAGAVPHRTTAGHAVKNPGLTTHQSLAAKLKAYLLVNLEPELDCANSSLAIEALEQAEFVVALSSFKSEALLQHAKVILPLSTFAETAGTLINAEQNWQSFSAAINPMGDAKPGWKILRVLANQLLIPEFDYESVDQITAEIKQALISPASLSQKWLAPDLKITPADNSLTRITEWPMYAVDPLVRHSTALQDAASNDPMAIQINANLAAKLNILGKHEITVRQNGLSKTLPVLISPRIPDNCVYIPAGLEATVGLGPSFGKVELYA